MLVNFGVQQIKPYKTTVVIHENTLKISAPQTLPFPYLSEDGKVGKRDLPSSHLKREEKGGKGRKRRGKKREKREKRGERGICAELQPTPLSPKETRDKLCRGSAYRRQREEERKKKEERGDKCKIQ